MVIDKLRNKVPSAEFKKLQRDHPLEYSCCTIVHSNCWKHLSNFPKGFVDLVVTDPPYGMNYKSGQKHHASGDDWDSKFAEAPIKGMIELPRIASYVFCRWDNLAENVTLPKQKSMLVWTKPGAGGTGDCAHEHIRDYEMAFFYPGPEHKFQRRPRSVLSFSGSGNPIHSTQKPVELIKEIFSWYDFETVFDPYMGSGTTAVAAIESGKHFFGFEAKKKYFTRAIQRIAEIGK
jgi:site-specific DNA-methyltransferase (adenine-specific)